MLVLLLSCLAVCAAFAPACACLILTSPPPVAPSPPKPHTTAAARCTREGAARAAFALLWAAAALALWSLAAYFKNVWTHFVAPLAPPTPRSRPGTPGGGGGRAKRA